MKKTCFYIGPYGEKNTLVHTWTDNVLEFLISPVVKKLKYMGPIFIDNVTGGDILSFDVIKHIVEDTLVVADLTEEDPIVFYQLAIRHILQKPVIYLIRKGDRLPFDLSDIKVISVRTDDLNIMENARLELRQQILRIEKGEYNHMPYVTKLKSLKNFAAGKPSSSDNDILISIFEQIEEIRLSLLDVKREVYDLSNQAIGISRKTSRSSTFVDKRLAKAELMRRKLSRN